jgi:hypothetical protein
MILHQKIIFFPILGGYAPGYSYVTPTSTIFKLYHDGLLKGTRILDLPFYVRYPSLFSEWHEHEATKINFINSKNKYA